MNLLCIWPLVTVLKGGGAIRVVIEGVWPARTPDLEIEKLSDGKLGCYVEDCPIRKHKTDKEKQIVTGRPGGGKCIFG